MFLEMEFFFNEQVMLINEQTIREPEPEKRDMFQKKNLEFEVLSVVLFSEFLFVFIYLIANCVESRVDSLFETFALAFSNQFVEIGRAHV